MVSGSPISYGRATTSPSTLLSRGSGFHELQGHPVALSDGQVFRLVLLTRFECRRQVPDAVRVVLRVVGIGVDLAAGGQLETSGLGELDDVILVDVTRLRLRILRAAGLAAVLLDAEDAARLQRAIGGRENGL